MASEGADLSQYTCQTNISVAELKCETAFNSLTDKEKAYAHHIAAASWEGAKICLLQTSVESTGAFQLLQFLFSAQSPAKVAAAAKEAGVSGAEVKAFLAFCANFFSNLGNYKSFGDTKFIPGLPKESFRKILEVSAAYAADAARIDDLWSIVGDKLYDLRPRLRQLGLGEDHGVSNYYSANITTADVELVQRFMEANNLSPYNTRLFKVAENTFQLRAASATKGAYPGFDEPVSFEGATITFVRGDHSALMGRAADQLEAAARFAANDEQRAMLGSYVKSFRDGDVSDHMEGSRHWIRDKGPIVESYIGFIESYQDPSGVRGEWEGFVAVVNKEQSAKFGELVGKAEALLPLMPWEAAYEKDVFLRPDFTSLEVVAFGSSGIPAGINIPNYDSIRQTEGFKNVSLGNVLSARDLKERVSFLGDHDQDLFRKYLVPSFEVQVGLHEVLGHGSGKLFTKDAEGNINCDALPIHPDTGAEVDTFYGPGQTWDTVFSTIASSYEECRAECVGIYLCVNEKVLEIFGHPGEEGDDIVYTNWVSMARAGLLALMFYTPGKGWGQAHMQARFAILQVMLACGVAEIVGADGVTKETVASAKEAIEARKVAAASEEGEGESKGEDGATELGVYVRVHRDKIRTVGVEAVGKFLNLLQVYKATADYARGSEMYNKYCTVPDSLLIVRDLILANRKARSLFVQPVTSISHGGKVSLQRFDATVEGVIESFVARYPATDDELDALWRADLEAQTV